MKTLLHTLFIISLLHANAIAQQPDLSRLADSLQHLIDKNYYDSSAGLYTETNQRATDEKPYSYLWPLCALVQAGNEMERLHPGKDYMSKVIGSIEKYYDATPPSPGYDAYPEVKGRKRDSRFYDDNQWIGLACVDAYLRNKNMRYLQIAQVIHTFMMTGFDTLSGGGLYWKEDEKNSKNTCSNGPGIVLALRLYQATHQKGFLDTALVLYKWTNQRLRSPKGLYYDNIRIPGKKIDSAFYSYNSGTMIQANVLLYELTKDNKYIEEARRLSQASLDQFFINGNFRGIYWFNAVLLRGYEELFRVDKDRKYLVAMQTYLDNNRRKEMDGLSTGKKIKLLDAAGYLEMVCRMALVR
jgi:Glycosyl hydrolase family 76